jgi:molybdate transport system substrate-binding protein
MGAGGEVLRGQGGMAGVTGVAGMAEATRVAAPELISGRFGAVGAIKEALLAGEGCDVIVLTAALIDALAADGRVLGATDRPLGRVRTGVAVQGGAALPAVGDADALRAALLAADALYVPDMQRSTAGAHVASVLERLGIGMAMKPRLREFPDGATAMAALAANGSSASIGLTQITEIRYTAGLVLVAPLPPAFELATVYTAAVTAGAATPERADRLAALLTSSDMHALREAGGFEA